jgi:hypothetical protein
MKIVISANPRQKSTALGSRMILAPLETGAMNCLGVWPKRQER